VWAQVSDARRGHMQRVAELLGEWAGAMGLEEVDRLRWQAAGWLHDALRDAPPEDLRSGLGDRAGGLPDPLLHGPAAAARLDEDIDGEMALAIRHHTTGHPDLGPLGRGLYIADFLEPGREWSAGWRAGLRARMPGDEPAVLREVLRARIAHQMELNRPLRPETTAFWNTAVEERAA
jgi:HD superfamily phosphohydrolase YqeK